MKVRDLMLILADEDPEAEVHMAYAVRFLDGEPTIVAPPITGFNEVFVMRTPSGHKLPIVVDEGDEDFDRTKAEQVLILHGAD